MTAANWAGNVTFSARRLHRPASVGELQELVAAAGQIRALGTGHSFSRIADSAGELVSVAGLPPRIDIDAGRHTVTVAAGVRYGELAGRLHQHGYALPNLGSLPHISVAGACATGTHGSGDTNGNLATAVAAVEMVAGDGELVVLSRDADGDAFCGAVVALGCLGVVTSLTLDLVPAFDVRQYVYEGLPFGRLDDHFDDVLGAAYSVSLFTRRWGPSFEQVWLKRRLDVDDPRPPDRRWMGAVLADRQRHPAPGMPADYCTPQLGEPGPWHERLPHFRLEFTPGSGHELQAEYLVPRRFAIDALHAVRRIRDRVGPVLRVSEIRTVAADELWLSPSYRRDSVGIHFTWLPDAAAVTPVLAAVEDQLAPFGARPHWGKLFGTGPDVVRELYDRLPDFQRLRHRYDPTGTFGNELVDRYFPAGDGRGTAQAPPAAGAAGSAVPPADAHRHPR